MIDKQIIIDGVDVSGCDELVNECDCYLTQEHDYRSSTPYTYNKCSGFPNCYYKQFKRSEAQCEDMFVTHTDLEMKYKAKEQECEELKVENKKLKEELLDLKLQFEEEQLMYEI